MAPKAKKQIYKRTKSRFHILRVIFYIIKRTLAIPTVKPILVIIALFSWLYYSGEYDTLIYKTNEANANIAKAMGLTLKDILLEGQEHTAREDILDVIATHSKTTDIVAPGESIFNINLKELKAQLESLTWVKHASAERLYPSTLSISIIERTPIALWQDEGRVFLIDQNGQIIKEKNLENYSNMIILVGNDVPTHAGSLLNLIRSEESLADMVSSATRISNRRWDIKLYNGTVINLPEEKSFEAWSYLARTNEESTILESDTKNIDLRVEGKMFVR